MPGPASHMFIAEKIAEKFNIFDDEEIYKLTSGKNRKYYKMGSSGPDLFFFAPDYEFIYYPSLVLPFIRDIVGPISDAYDKIKPIVNVIDNVEEAAKDVGDDVTCNAVSNVADRLVAINKSLATVRDSYMVNLFSKSVGMFDRMRPPHQKKGLGEKSWFWFDILHSRRTGEFLQKMWDNSVDDKQKAYVLGYATHVAADISGHPYVNQAVGGAPRAFNQRHHFVENIMDTWFYDKGLLPSVNITNAKLHRELPHGEEVDDKGILLAVLGGAVETKDDLQGIFEMVSTSMSDTFLPPDELPTENEENKLPNGLTSAEDINLAYWLLLASYKISTDSFIPRPEGPLGSTLDDIVKSVNEFLDNAAANPPTPPNAPSDHCYALWRDNCDFSLDKLQEWMEYLWDNIAYLGEFLEWAGSVLIKILKVLDCVFTAEAKVLISAFLWLIQSTLYAIVEQTRETLVLAAIAHPQPEWVRNNPIAQEIVELSDRSVNEARKELYPHRAQPSNAPHLRYPTTPVENAPTMPGPYPEGSTPASILTGIGNGGGLDLYNEYANSKTPEDTMKIQESNMQKETLPAIPLAMKIFDILRDKDKQMPDWNLDADRGYHYKNWTADWNRLAHDYDDENDSDKFINEKWHNSYVIPVVPVAPVNPDIPFIEE